jgi:hypothetical protein
MVNATGGGVSTRHLPSSRPSLSKVVEGYYVQSDSGLIGQDRKDAGHEAADTGWTRPFPRILPRAEASVERITRCSI